MTAPKEVFIVCRVSEEAGSRVQQRITADQVETWVDHQVELGFHVFLAYGPRDDTGKRPLLKKWTA